MREPLVSTVNFVFLFADVVSAVALSPVVLSPAATDGCCHSLPSRVDSGLDISRSGKFIGPGATVDL